MHQCEICGKESDTQPVRFPNGKEIKLCEEHAEDIFTSLKERDLEQEIVPFKFVVIIITVIAALSMIFMWIAVNKNNPYGLSGFPYLGLVMAYIISFTTPSIYNRVLKIGKLKDISVKDSVRDLEARDIIQIDATVIAGALVLLTLSSSLGVGGYLAHVLGVQSVTVITNVTGAIVLIFAFSAVAVSIFRYIEIGRRLMVAGFVYLFFAMLVLTFFT
jgi:hypothetical protein